MGKAKSNFAELEEKLLSILAERKCTKITMTGYRYVCNSIFRELQNSGITTYTETVGVNYLDNYLANHGFNEYYRVLKTTIRRLNDVTNGVWNDRHYAKRKFCLSKSQNKVVEDYCKKHEHAGMAQRTISKKEYGASLFLEKLNDLGCTRIEDISASYVCRVCVGIESHGLWGQVRMFLKYLSDEKIIHSDYSTLLSHRSAPYILPSTYTVDEISAAELEIDRNTDMGKRDYAMFLFASRLGMRSGDIVRLTIDQVDFKNNKVCFTQQKTKKPHELPLLPEIEVALKDYIEIRPATKTKILFLTMQAPYQSVTTSVMRHIVRRYLAAAEVDIRNKRHGPHALRASLATSMVNDGIPYEVVRKVLGHSSSNAIKSYARIDIERLREYSIETPSATGRFRNFLCGKAVRTNE